VSNHYAIARIHLATQDSLTGILLRVEAYGRTLEVPKHWVNTGSLHNATILGDVTEEHCQTAILGVSMLQVADTTVFSVCIEAFPLCILATHLGRELSARGRMIDSVSLWVDAGTCDIIFLHLFCKGMTIHTHHVAIDKSALVQLVQDAQDTTGTVALLHAILLSIRRELAEARHLAAQSVDVFHLEVGTSFLSHSQQVEHGVGATAHGDIKCHGVEEGVTGSDVAWQNALVTILIVCVCILNHLAGSLLEEFDAVLMGSKNGSVSRKTQTDSLGKRVHGVGCEHTRAASATRAGTLFNLLHGQGLENIYHWKESVGPLKDRKPAKNIWNYHQTRKLGFFEYFQWCEDMGAEPLPVLAAGVPCQNSVADERGVAGQQGGIPMSEMPQYIQDVLDLVEWANGDPATSKWAKMRADAGHPAPFNLKMIGIGNEDLISTDFEQRYLMICKAVKQKYPQIEVVGTVGPFHFPSSDYIEGWKIARENKRWIDAVDEHYYEQPGWFLNHQDYYDHYDRKAPKVYLGEYASRGANAVDNALAEGIHLCNVERNGDVVEMTSYAPLLCKDGYSNWQPDMIYFDNNNVRASESYKMQKMFGQHAGDLYISSVLSLPDALKKYVGTSVVKDSKSGKTWLKVVNALPRTLKLSVSGLGNKQVTIAGRSAQVFEL
jgi:alpha-L-arabinofuranosidase